MKKLEEIYKDLCEKENPLYFYAYSLVKSRLEKSYFPYLRDFQPFKTDHGIGHINRILEKLSHFLKPHLPLPGNPNDRIIDIENLNLLMHAVLWHDLGNLYGRLDHAQNITRVFDGVKFFLYESADHEWVLKIAQAHSGAGSIEKIIKESSAMIYDSVIYPQFLSALLRISDEIDEDSRRAEGRVISRVPKENEAYWQFCLCTESIIPVYQTDSLRNMVLEIQIKCKMRNKVIGVKCGKGTGEVTVIEEYISRVNKINEERIYCNKFLQQYSALYFRKIDRTVAEVAIYDETDKILDKVHFVFTDDTKGSDFFNDAGIREILKKYDYVGGLT
jgi:hypothetical protein